MSTDLNNRGFILSKVPEVTIFFWIIKVLCTTVGETFSDFLNVNLGLGLIVTTVIMGVAFFVVLFFQLKAAKYNPILYWLTVVLISIFGTLVTDNLTDGLGVPLEFSTMVFSILLGLTFIFWYLNENTLSIHSIHTRKREVFYWLTILFTFALGTAVGDLYSEQLGLGYLTTGIIVIIIIGCVALAWKMLKLNAILAFWVAYIFTRPLGASLGDYLSQSKVNGGLGLGATMTSILFLMAILAVILYLAISKIDISSNNESDSSKSIISSPNKVWTQTILVLCLFLAVGIGGYEWRNQDIASQTDSSQTTLKGQLSDFIAIENDILANIHSANFTSAKSGADSLEHDWDQAEPKLRKMDRRTWTQIDGTIDGVLAAVRSKKTDAGRCETQLNQSLDVLTAANQ